MKSDSCKSLSFRIRQIAISIFCLFAVVCIITSLYTLSNSHGNLNKRKRSLKPRSLPEDKPSTSSSAQTKASATQTNKASQQNEETEAAKLAEVDKQANIEDVTDTGVKPDTGVNEETSENEGTPAQLNLFKSPVVSSKSKILLKSSLRKNTKNSQSDNEWKEIDINATVNVNYNNNDNDEGGIEPVTFDDFASNKNLQPKKTTLKLTDAKPMATKDEVDEMEEMNDNDDNSGEQNDESESIPIKTDPNLVKVTPKNYGKSMQDTADEIINKLSNAHHNIDQIQKLIETEEKSNKKNTKSKKKKKIKKSKEKTIQISKNNVKSKNADSTKQILESSGDNEEPETLSSKDIPSKNSMKISKSKSTQKNEESEEASKLIDNEKRLSHDEDTENDKNTDDESKQDEKKVEEKKEDKNIVYPTFPENYHATGLLLLPHSRIAEPFEIWYAPSVEKSRIDYYYGTDKTIQRADMGEQGEAFKYVPMYSDKKGSFPGCWSLTGTKYRPIIPQVITPNLTWFKYDKTEVYTGVLTTKWTYEYYAFGMRNLQHVWVTKEKPYRPIRYEMFGFDMMLGSYYDNYVIEYISFEQWKVNEKRFELPKDMTCYNWTSSLETSLIVNPMLEFTAFSPERAVDMKARYLEYKQQYNKQQQKEKDEELVKRMHIFKHNVRYINSHNRRNLPFKLKNNGFLDMKPEELDMQHGNLEKDPRAHPGIKDSTEADKDLKQRPDIPEQVDWRDYGAVSPVQGQATCGACYAFTAAGVAEGAWFVKTGKAVQVSAQQLVDCSWGTGNHGCKGGHYAAGLSWIYTHGISTSKSYGKYLGQEGYCHFNDTWFGAKIDGFFYIQPFNVTALKYAIVNYGPVAVSLNTFPLSFKFYSHGVYSDPKCLSNRTQHSAIVVGFGKQNGEEYWLVKNSWSTDWGEDGYIKIAIKDHICGVTQYPIAAIMKHPTFKLPMQSKITHDDEMSFKKPTASRNNIDTQSVQESQNTQNTHNSSKTKNETKSQIKITFSPTNKTTGINKDTNEKTITTLNRVTIQISKLKNISADTAIDPSETSNANNGNAAAPRITLSLRKTPPADNKDKKKKLEPNPKTQSDFDNDEEKVGEDSEVHPAVNGKYNQNTIDGSNEFEKIKYALLENKKQTQNNFSKNAANILQDKTNLLTNTKCPQDWVECNTYGKNIFGAKTLDPENKAITLVTDEPKSKAFESDGDTSNKIKIKPTKVVYENQDDSGFIVSTQDQLKTNEIDEPNEHTNIVEAPPEVEETPTPNKKLSEKQIKIQKVKQALKNYADKQAIETGMNVIKLPATMKFNKEPKKPVKKKPSKSTVIPFFGLHIKDEDEISDGDSNNNTNKNNDESTDENYKNFDDEIKEKTNSTPQSSVSKKISKANTTSNQSRSNDVKDYPSNSKVVAIYDTSAVNSDNKSHSNDNENPANNLAETVSNINQMNLNSLDFGDHVTNLKNNHSSKDQSLNDERFEEISAHLIDLRKEVFNETENLIMPTERLFNNPIEKENEMREQKADKQIKIIDNENLKKNNFKPVHNKSISKQKKVNKKAKVSTSHNGNESKKMKELSINKAAKGPQEPKENKNIPEKVIKESPITALVKIDHPNTPSMKSNVQSTPHAKVKEALKNVIRKLPLLHVAQNIYHHAVQKEKQKKTAEIKQKVLQHQKEFHQFVKNLKTKHLTIDSSWNKPTLDPEKIGTFLDERLKQRNRKIRPEQATLLGSKKHIIAKHSPTDSSAKHIQGKGFIIPYTPLAKSETVSKYNMEKISEISLDKQKTTKKDIHKKKLSKVDQAYQDSMDFLYQRINQAVQKKVYK